MRARFFLTILIAATLILGSSVQAQTKGATATKKATTVQSTAGAKYSCPMHPEVTSDKVGKCSKCGMELTKKTTATAQKAKATPKKKEDKGCSGSGCGGGGCGEHCEE